MEQQQIEESKEQWLGLTLNVATRQVELLREMDDLGWPETLVAPCVDYLLGLLEKASPGGPVELEPYEEDEVSPGQEVYEDLLGMPVECLPALGFSNRASWRGYLDDSAEALEKLALVLLGRAMMREFAARIR